MKMNLWIVLWEKAEYQGGGYTHHTWGTIESGPFKTEAEARMAANAGRLCLRKLYVAKIVSAVKFNAEFIPLET